MKKKWMVVVVAMIMAFVCTGYMKWRTDSMVEELADEVLRFHVLANSDNEEDQLLKLEVKEAVISYMKASLGEDQDLRQTVKWAEDHLEQLEQISEAIIREHGYEYSVTASVREDDFPEKSYGDITFPAGKYQALRIEIGEAKGQNWWCVLYPNLCFLDATHAVVPEEGKQELENVLEEDTYQLITNPPRWRIRWFFFW